MCHELEFHIYLDTSGINTLCHTPAAFGTTRNQNVAPAFLNSFHKDCMATGYFSLFLRSGRQSRQSPVLVKLWAVVMMNSI